jgi:hypothetical protein
MLRAVFAVAVLAGAVASRGAAQAVQVEPLVALTATFRTETRNGDKIEHRAWRLTRTPDQVEVEWLDDGWVDIWRLEHGGALSLLKVSDAERTVVEYAPNQIRDMRGAPSWRVLNSVLPGHPTEMGLRYAGKLEAMGQPAERYTGTLGRKSIMLIWFPRERIPYRLVTTGDGRTTQLRLRGLSFAAPSIKKARRLSEYRRLSAHDADALQALPATPPPKRRSGVQIHF